jgi:hypothetical protein
MKARRPEAYRRLSALAETTEQAAFRQISDFALSAEREGDAAEREAAQKVLVRAAKTFTQLLSMTFQAVAWNKEVLYEEEPFEAIYQKVCKATAGFTKVGEGNLAELLASYPPSLLMMFS